MEVKKSAQLVAAALKNSLADERGRWVLGPQRDARSEYRLRFHDKAQTRTLVMDRVFRDAKGTSWIVDYKTSRHEGAGTEAFLERERSRYAPQLRAYAAALPGARTGLYFPQLKAWREIT